MRIGRKRHRVTIEEFGPTINEYNEEVEDWSFYAKVWAEVEDLSGREFHLARQVPAGEVTTRVKIRWRSDINPTKMRIVHGDRKLGIEAVLDAEGRKRELVLMCKELKSGETAQT